MATLTKGKTFINGEIVTPQKLHELVDLATVSAIVTADISDAAVTTAKITNAAVTADKIETACNLSGKTLTLPNAQALNYPRLVGVREAVVDLGTVSGTQTLNLQNGNIFQIKPNGNVTITFSNVPASGTFVGVLLRHEGTGTDRTYTFPSGIKWAYGESPTFTITSGKFDIVSLFTYNGGTTWFGQILGQNY